VDGQPLGEKKLWLQDDYVKFLRFAQWKIHKAGKGIVGMITNHSYLDNPTFRGMRQSLMNTYNEIYILDLHGSLLKKETTPEGGKDENVFDIRQGVAIALFVKQEGKTGCKVYHFDQYGLREKKYQWLEKKDVESCKYKNITPKSPWYFLIPRDTKNIQEYLKWPKVNEIFPVNNVGIITARDKFVIDFEEYTLKNRIRQFRDLNVDDSIIKEAFQLKDTSTFKLTNFRKEFAKTSDWESLIKPITCRPFDDRFICYSKWIVERPIYDTMRHMLHEGNLGLNVVRQVKTGESWQHCLISNKITESCYLSNKTGEIGYLCPLYLYPEEKESKSNSGITMTLFEPEVPYGKKGRAPNIAPEIFEMLKKAYMKQPSPEDILYYIYAILYSNKYREKYAEFLKIDFPRIPFTSNFKLFKKTAGLGEKSVQLHLLDSPDLDPPIAKYKGTADNDTIEKPVYQEKEQRIYINKVKYFERVTKEVWEYQIGGYQVLDKYLKDRAKAKKRKVDSRPFCNMITAIAKTIELQKKIDILFSEVEKEIIS